MSRERNLPTTLGLSNEQNGNTTFVFRLVKVIKPVNRIRYSNYHNNAVVRLIQAQHEHKDNFKKGLLKDIYV